MTRSACLLVIVALIGCVSGKAVLEPDSGAWFGVSIDFGTTTVSQYLSTSGVSPVIYNVFVSLPLNGTTTSYLEQTLPQIAAAKAVCLMTIEPDQGLPAVTTAAVQELASYITQYEQAGASFMIRYAHEMNGNWYVWGQQPTEYINSHKLVAGVLRNSTCGVAMVWAPNSAVGYPWASNFQSGTALSPQLVPGSADFKLMDTNGDGQITSLDDPFAPYYPGDAWVDWVGMSSFHFGGSAFPFTANQQAAPMAFTSGFTGNNGTAPNFYASYSADGVHKKPMVITETSAMYNPSNPSGQTDYSIKQNWWQQVFNVNGDNANALDMSAHFPNVKAVMWFDEIKVEAQAGGATIDWRFTGNQQIQSGLGIFIQTPAKNNGATYWKQLSDFTSSTAAISCSAKPTAGTASVTKTPTATPVTTTAATYSNTVPVSAPPSPPAPTGTTSTQNAATTQTLGAANQSQTQTGGVAALANLIGRRLLQVA